MKTSLYLNLGLVFILVAFMIVAILWINAPSTNIQPVLSYESLVDNLQSGLQNLTKEIDSKFLNVVKDEKAKKKLDAYNKRLKENTEIVNKDTGNVDTSVSTNVQSILNEISKLAETEYNLYKNNTMNVLANQIRILTTSLNEIINRSN